MSGSKTVRIVPVPNNGDGATKTHGTQVWCGGERLRVSKLTLIAEPNDSWKAVIETPVQICGEIVAQVEEAPREPPT